MHFIIEPFVMSAVRPKIVIRVKRETQFWATSLDLGEKSAFSPGCLRCSFYWDQIDLLHIKPSHTNKRKFIFAQLDQHYVLSKHMALL